MNKFIKTAAKEILKPAMPMIRNSRWYTYTKWGVKARIAYLKTRGVHKHMAKRFISYNKNRNLQFIKLFEKIQVELNPNSRFQHWINEDLYFMNPKVLTDSLPPAYELILKKSISDLLEQNSEQKNEVQKNNYLLLLYVKDYIKRIVKELSQQQTECTRRTKSYFERMLDSETANLEEALQRILFWSSIFWQSGHCLIGLGRLDKILAPYADNMSEQEILKIFSDFFMELHRYYSYKSSSLMGDTGQIVILGGVEPDGNYFCNNLTYCFIKAMKSLSLPDPKLLLRCSEKMPQALLALAIECNATGIGCPLLSNDDVVIPALEGFGYTHEDACNYVTSACWEPFCYGKSLGRQNLGQINYAQVFENTYKSSDFTSCPSFEDIICKYIDNLKIEVKARLSQTDKIRWEKNPLMTMFTDGCMQCGKDIGDGGAVYNDYGILSVGLANAVNSLLNIKHLVFENKEFTLEGLKTAAKKNFADTEEIRKRLFDSAYFAHDDEEVLSLIARITGAVSEICSGYKNYLGGGIKFGLSSPAYMECGAETGATLDGRKARQPLSVHISAKLGEPYTELINFAGKLDYSALRCNGNVVDFFVSPNFIQNNFDKFCLFIRQSIKIGFFQMQMNVVSYKTLVEAKKNPELYPNLVVRVWGFSAYFKDLPEQYKDLLIQRALESERAA